MITTTATAGPARRARSAPSWASTVLVVVAVTAGLSGLVVAVGTYQGQPTTVGSVGRAGDLSLEVDARRWVAHEMETMPGMAMAGMPAAGFRRLHLEVAISNRGDRAQSFGPHQFRLIAPEGRWGLKSSSFVTGALGPGQSMAGDLFFDVPEKATDASLRLAWAAPGRDVLFRLGTTGRGHDDDAHGDEKRRS